jgi:hypothetical protein
MKFITVKTTIGEETLVNLEKINYIQRTNDNLMLIDMASAMLELFYDEDVWIHINSAIAMAENKQYSRYLQKPLDVKVVNK